MSFTIQDFDTLVSRRRGKVELVDNKLKELVERVSQGIDYHSGVYRYKNRYVGFFSRSSTREVFFNLQINSEDLSLEFQIENKDLAIKFIRNMKVNTLNNFKDQGDFEIVVWDKDKKVCKLYPGYLDERTRRFLLDKIKSTRNPIFKFRKIYSRNEPILRSTKLKNDIVNSIRQMEVFYRYLS